MKILLVNEFVRNGGGTDAVVRLEMDALRALGHAVTLFSRDNRAFDTARGAARVRLFAETLYSRSARRQIESALRKAAASGSPYDVVHVHNVVPLLGGAVYDACRAAGVPIAQHLHNYRAMCLSSYGYRDGRVCTASTAAGLARCVAGRCYRDSLAASVGLAGARLVERFRGRPLGMEADLFIAPSEHVRRRHVEAGIPAERVVVVPNPAGDLRALVSGEAPADLAAAGPRDVPDAATGAGADEGSADAHERNVGAVNRPRLVYVGGLLAEKGVDDLVGLAAALPDWDLLLLGEGPRRDALESAAAERGLDNLRLLGFLGDREKAQAWAGAFLTLTPSRWEEPFGVVAAESLALGIPLLSSGAGGLREVVDGGCGWIVDFGRPDSVAALVRDLHRGALRADYETACRAARARYEAEYSQGVFGARLEAALGAAASAGDSPASGAGAPSGPEPAPPAREAATPRPPARPAASRRLRIALVGTRGVPAAYSGFETAVENLGTRLAARGHDVVVYCRPHMVEGRYRTYRGMRLVYLPTIASKHLDTFVHTLLSTLHMGFLKRRDVAVYFIAGNAPFAGLSRLLGIPSAINVDGLDSRRAKWGGPARRYIRWAEHNAPRLACRVITDSRVLQRIYAEEHRAQTDFIPYGSDVPPAEEAEQVLAGLGLRPRGYLLFVGRLVPENNAHVLVEAFGQLAEEGRLPEGLDLAIVGDAPYVDDYIAGLRERAAAIEDGLRRRILFPGYQFGAAYHALAQNCALFVIPTEVGGTHPVLLEAMAAGACVVVNDHEPNLEALGEAGASYPGAGGAPAHAQTIAALLDDGRRCAELRKRAAQRARSVYSWDAVTDSYERLALRLAGRQPSASAH